MVRFQPPSHALGVQPDLSLTLWAVQAESVPVGASPALGDWTVLAPPTAIAFLQRTGSRVSVAQSADWRRPSMLQVAAQVISPIHPRRQLCSATDLGRVACSG